MTKHTPQAMRKMANRLIHALASRPMDVLVCKEYPQHELASAAAMLREIADEMEATECTCAAKDMPFGRCCKSLWKSIDTSHEDETVLVTWSNNGDTFYELDTLVDGIWTVHNDRYEHYLSCRPSDIPCTGPSEEAPYTHWMHLPVLAGAPSPEGGV